MAEENKKGGFWASLFGRNKKQDEPKIEPTIEEEKIKDIEPSIEKLETHDLVEEPSELEAVESAVDFFVFLLIGLSYSKVNIVDLLLDTSPPKP